MEESNGSGQIPENLEQTKGYHPDQPAGGFRVFETEPDMTLTRQVVNLGGLGYKKDTAQGCGILQVHMVNEQPLSSDGGIAVEFIQPGLAYIATAAHKAVNVVSLLEQQFRQIGSVLTRDSGYDSTRGHLKDEG
jgi:hypothetical protein